MGEKNQRPFIISHWKNGVENGIGKIYYTTDPYNLQKIYNTIEGQMWIIETYYSSGQLEAKFTDTVIADEDLKYMQEYYENGSLKHTGYYVNGKDIHGKWTNYFQNGQIESTEMYNNGKLNGDYKYYHKNGQLWTRRTYRYGKLWNVHSNFDAKGKKKNKGTIENGTGTLNRYDANGNLSRTVKYVDGIINE